jgi:hypothetical protein
VSTPAERDPADSGRRPSSVPPRGGKAKGRPSRPAPPSKGRQARQAAQRRNRNFIVVGVVAAVAIVVGVIVAIAGGSSGPPRKPALISAVNQLGSVPVSVLVDASTKVTALNYAQAAQGGPLTSAGKPEVLFIGAEFCPICGAERWPMTLALMKFGTFTNLKQTHSAVADGNVGTWSYEGATYSSPYLVFKPYELYTNQPSGGYYKTLDTLPQDASTIWKDNLGSNLTFPFIDFGGKEVLETAQFNPSSIYNHSFATILGAVGANDNTIGASIDSSAAVFTKYLCGLTNNQPGSVCNAVKNVNAPVGQANTGTSSQAGGQ